MVFQYCESKSQFKERPILSNTLFKFRVDSQIQIQRNPDFLNPHFLNLRSLERSPSVILTPILEPICISLGDSKNLDSTLLRTCNFFR